MKTIDELGISPWPWKFSGGRNPSVICDGMTTIKDGLPIVCHLTKEESHGNMKRRNNNASLIAAAPELYEALRELYDYCFASYTEQFNSFEDVCAKAEAALAKASGEEVA